MTTNENYTITKKQAEFIRANTQLVNKVFEMRINEVLAGEFNFWDASLRSKETGEVVATFSRPTRTMVMTEMRLEATKMVI